jgi:hypothetical protein
MVGHLAEKMSITTSSCTSYQDNVGNAAPRISFQRVNTNFPSTITSISALKSPEMTLTSTS